MVEVRMGTFFKRVILNETFCAYRALSLSLSTKLHRRIVPHAVFYCAKFHRLSNNRRNMNLIARPTVATRDVIHARREVLMIIVNKNIAHYEAIGLVSH